MVGSVECMNKLTSVTESLLGDNGKLSSLVRHGRDEFVIDDDDLCEVCVS